MYLAKRRGRNQVARASDLTESGEFLVSIEANEVEWLKRRVAALSIRAKDLYVQSVAALLQALEEKDSYTGRHAMNTAYYAQQIAEQLGLSPASVKSVHNAALLHDIGKVGVPDRILMKQTPLTPLEKMVLDQVPLISVRILDHLRILEAEMQIIRHQREYFDGSGLPARLRGTQIPIGSRILLAADAFDAMTTDRVYRSRRPIPDVLAEMRLLAGKQFDPDVVRAMEALLADHLPLWQARIEETIEQLRLPRAADRTVAESSTAS
jgi:putative nucleotidyltransferase with HDIG domain